LAALKDWTFILGSGFIVGLGDGLILGYLMYSSGLAPLHVDRGPMRQVAQPRLLC
jgi:hypothetical protein